MTVITNTIIDNNPFIDLLPCNFYCVDSDLTILDCNEIQANFHGCERKDLRGKSLKKLINKEQLSQVYENNISVKKLKCMQIFEENHFKMEHHLLCLSLKFPFVVNKKVLGTYGFSINIANQNFNCATELFNKLTKEKTPITEARLKKIMGATEIGGILLSRQETRCLQYTVQGKTAKETALLMDLSFRTIESYLEHIKVKLNCRTKSELIDYALSEEFYFYKKKSS